MGRSRAIERRRMESFLKLTAVLVLAMLACTASEGVEMLDAEAVAVLAEQSLPKKVDGIAVADLRKAVHNAVVKAVANRKAGKIVSKQAKKVAKVAKKMKRQKKERKSMKKALKATVQKKKIKLEVKKATKKIGEENRGRVKDQEKDVKDNDQRH